jgi:TM2 domain-containing membrane protein YozV
MRAWLTLREDIGMADIGAHELREITSDLDDTSRVIFQTQYSSEKKDRGITILLALFALDRFYFGQIGLGILKYLSLVIVIGLFWWLIDIFTAGGRADEFNRNKAREIAVSLRT